MNTKRSGFQVGRRFLVVAMTVKELVVCAKARVGRHKKKPVVGLRLAPGGAPAAHDDRERRPDRPPQADGRADRVEARLARARLALALHLPIEGLVP